MTKPDRTTRPEETGKKPTGEEAAISWNSFLSTYLPALILALGAGIVLPVVPNLAQSFDVSFGVASGVVTVFLIGTLAGALPSGWLIDRFGPRPILFAGPALTALTALLVVFVDSFVQLLMLRFLSGFAAQMWLMARLTLIARNTPANQRGTAGLLDARQRQFRQADRAGARRIHRAFMGAAGALCALRGSGARRDDPDADFLARGGRKRNARSRAREAAAAPASPMTLSEIIMPRLVYFGVAIFAGLTRGPVQADLLHLYAAFAYDLGPKALGYLATGAAMVSWPIALASGWMMDRFRPQAIDGSRLHRRNCRDDRAGDHGLCPVGVSPGTWRSSSSPLPFSH